MENNQLNIGSRNDTVKVILFTSKKLATGEYPVMLRITKNYVRKYISLGFSCPLKFWDKAKELPKANHPKRSELASLMNRFEKEFTDKIQDYNFHSKEYTIDELVDAILKKTKSAVVAEYIDDLVSTLKEEKRMGTAKSNNDCKLMLFKFHPDRKLTFREIDYVF